jgi:hypothetical protein
MGAAAAPATTGCEVDVEHVLAVAYELPHAEALPRGGEREGGADHQGHHAVDHVERDRGEVGVVEGAGERRSAARLAASTASAEPFTATW